MFKSYPDEQCVRGIMRFFPNKNKNENLRGLDIGCGAGRHSKLILDMGFTVKAVDNMPKNVIETFNVLEEYNKEKFEVECIDFLKINDKETYDLVIAWHFIYAYNNEPSDCLNKILKIKDMLKEKGKIIMSLKSHY